MYDPQNLMLWITLIFFSSQRKYSSHQIFSRLDHHLKQRAPDPDGLDNWALIAASLPVANANLFMSRGIQDTVVGVSVVCSPLWEAMRSPKNSCLHSCPEGQLLLFRRKGTPRTPLFQSLAFLLLCLSWENWKIIANSLHGECQLPTYENIHIIKT